MATDDVPLIVVRCQFDDARTAQCRLSDLRRVHWDFISGGARKVPPWPFMYAYVWCSDLVGADDFPHSCVHGSGPHLITVCIVKKDNRPRVFAELERKAGPKPRK
jgi:hypothetical protein